MYVKLQAKLTAKESNIYQIVQNKDCFALIPLSILFPGQYLVYFTTFSQLVRLPSWLRRSCACYLRILRVQMVFNNNRNIVRHNLHTFS